MAYLLGIDIGTSGTKTILMDETGKILAQASEEYPLDTPQPGWSEQNPEYWWQAACHTTKQVIQKSGVDPKEIKGVGYSGQMHGSVFLDKDGKVVRPCLLWNDGRTYRECEEITRKATPAKLHEWVSNPAMTGFTAPKIVWLRNNEPENFKKVAHVLLPKDYVRYRMTGEYATDITDAAGTTLYHVRERRWATELLDILEIPREWMPRVEPSYGITGHVTAAASAECGLAVGTPVVGGGADNPCGAVGSGVVAEGRVMLSLGTSGVIFSPSSKPEDDPEGRLHFFNAAPPNQWYFMGVMLSAGMNLRWYRDKFAAAECAQAKDEGRDPYEILIDKAASVEPGAEGLYFLPYLTGERTPVNDPLARGAFVGYSYRHGTEHTIRSLVEGISFGLRHNLDVVRERGIKVDQIRVIGGGSKSPFWRQLLADLMNAEIAILKTNEGPAQGAAILAGVGTGVFGDIVETCDRLLSIDSVIAPNPKMTERYEEIYSHYAGIYPALKAHFHEVHKMLEKK
jgi:xylulokinase